MNSQEYVNYITKIFFTLKFINKLYHWNTTSYPRHIASDRFDDVLESLMDKFMEVFIGRYQIKPLIHKLQIEEAYLNDKGIETAYKQVRDVLSEMQRNIPDSDLLNIRDELVAEINKNLCLFTLN
jgi:uncharacterized protein (DUF2267 family)